MILNVSPRKLRALAHGLGVSEDEIFTVAFGHKRERDLLEEVDMLFHGWHSASDETKRAALEAIRLIAIGFQQKRLAEEGDHALSSTQDQGDTSKMERNAVRGG
jgi:transcriptional regulator with XRE-family HTH domain